MTRALAGRLMYAGALIAVYLLSVAGMKALWLHGVDTGAAMAQCIDSYALLGPEAVYEPSCREAKDREDDVAYTLLRRR